MVVGCQHDDIGEIVRGLFTLQSENHGRPTYQKNVQANGLDVMLYFWDDRDGPAFTGWWFGPKVGGDQVWAFHPSQDKTPPATGWRVPFNGPLDPSMAVKASTALTTAGPQASQQPRAVAPPRPRAPVQPGQQRPAQTLSLVPVAPRAGQNAGPAQARFVMAPRSGGGGAPSRPDPREEQMKKKKEQEEMRKREQEEAKKRVEENKRRMEENNRKKQQEQEDEEKRLREFQERKKQELKAANEIRKAQQKVRNATANDFVELRRELETVLDAELKNTGEKQKQVLEDCEKILEEAQKRVDAVLQERQKEEEKKLEEERQTKEKARRAEELLAELGSLVEAAEKAMERAAGAAKAVLEESEPTVESVKALAVAAATAAADSAARAEGCSDFFREHHAEIRAAPRPPAEERPETDDPFDKAPEHPRKALAQLVQRINGCKKGTEAAAKEAAAARTTAEARAAAAEKTQNLQALFRKYDKDSDEMLSRRELVAYVKGEFAFNLPDSAADRIWEHRAEYSAKHGEKGIRFGNFQMVRVAVGIERELKRDRQRTANREAMERQLEALKAETQDKIERATERVKEADEAVTKAEETMRPLLGAEKGKATPVPEMKALAEQIGEAVAAAKECVATAREEMDDLKQNLDDRFKAEILRFIGNETKKQDTGLVRMEAKVKRFITSLSQFQEEVRKTRAAEVEKVGAAALRLARYQLQSGNLSPEELFRQVDVGGDGMIDRSDFVTFFNAADKVIRSVSPEGAGDASAAAQEGEEKPVETLHLDPEDLADAFPALCADGEDQLSQEQFARLLELHMVVVKESAMTDSPHMKESKPLRRLLLDEGVVVLRGPVRERDVGMLRTRVRALRDGAEGWVSAVGNAGTVFLREARRFKVVKDVAMTAAYEPEGEDVEVRKLKPGEEVAVEEWPTQPLESGALRMKVRAAADGAVGWATSANSSGAVFLRVA